MQSHPVGPAAFGASLWRNRDLIRTLVRRDIQGRYRGSFMGLAWLVVQPAFLLAIYTFVFSVVFKARWGASESRSEFALVLFAGLIVFNLFAECVTRAPSLVLGNPNYVKKVVFPLEILPVVALGSALFHAAVSVFVWLVAHVVLIGPPPPTALLLPLVVVPLLLFVLGVTWTLASLGVFLRDVAQVIGVVTTAMMFLSPIFYPVSALPEAYRPLLMANPLTPAVEQVRQVLYFGQLPDGALLAACSGGAMVVAALGFAWFQATRKGFADVL